MIESAVSWKLAQIAGHDRIFPDASWLRTDEQGGNPEILAALPVWQYRQSGGTSERHLSGERSTLRDDVFLVEIFADSREECATARDQVLDAFTGPLSQDWEEWGDWANGTPCKVHWAEADEPEAGAEFPEGIEHMFFRFARIILTVQWHRG